MCQQTRIATVLPYYHRWLRRFPTWSALARAPQSLVLRHWEGLGYYRRARYLHSLAKSVVRLPKHELPADPNLLLQLPGIGKYTAGAIASIAFEIPVPAFDGNVARVLGRLYAKKRCSPSSTQLQSLAALIVPRRNPGMHNQALMELGALICLPKNPHCTSCPLRRVCPSRSCLPTPTKTRSTPTQLREHLHIVRRGKKVWLTHQHPSNRWRGLHLLPTTATRSHNVSPIGKIIYPYTRYKISAAVFATKNPPKGFKGSWHSPKQLASATLPAPHRKALTLLP
jgi:A/G-specific adenine glycosylase